MSPIRVLCVFSSLNRGGAESMCMNLYRNIDRSKVQFDFVKHTHSKCSFEDEIINLGGRIYEAPRYKIYNYFQYRSWWIRHLKAHPEHQIIHGHFFTISAVYFRFAREMNRLTIGHSHSAKPGNGSLKSIMKAHSMKKVERLASYCFACSEDAGKWLYPHRKFKVINNAIDAKAFTYDEEKRKKIRDEFGIKEEFVVGHVGNFAPVKNHTFLVDVFKVIHDRNPNSKLIMVGGNDHKAIEEKVKGLGMSDSVIFTGVRSDIADILQSFDVFVFPSIDEGLGMVAIEAQAAGLYTICSDVVPSETRITNLIIFVSLGKSASEWADIVLKYNTGYKREDTSEQIQRACYDIHTTAKLIEKFYTSVSKRGKK